MAAGSGLGTRLALRNAFITGTASGSTCTKAGVRPPVTLCALNAKTLALRKDARAMTAVHQKVTSSLLAPDAQPGGSPAEQRRSSSPNPLYRICPAFDVRRPLCEGYLFKQSHQNEVVFNKRYFALYPEVLVYYKSQADCEHDKQKNRLTVSRTTGDGHCPVHPHPARPLLSPTETKADGVPPYWAVFDEAAQEAEGVQVLLDPSHTRPEEHQEVRHEPAGRMHALVGCSVGLFAGCATCWQACSEAGPDGMKRCCGLRAVMQEGM